MIRMLIVGYCFGIRSERRLCDEVHLNLGYRWFCRLGLDAAVPDHSTFSKARHGRFRDADLLRQVFETVVRRCMAEGLVGGEGFAVDASMIEADANRQRGVPGSEGLAPEAASHVDEYLAVLDDAAFGAATPVVPKFISPADPASRWTGANGGLAFFAYCHQLPDRPEARRHPGRRADHGRAPGRSHGGQASMIDRSAGALRALARAARRRYRLRVGRDAGLAGARARRSSRISRCSTSPPATDGTLRAADFTYDHDDDAIPVPPARS